MRAYCIVDELKKAFEIGDFATIKRLLSEHRNSLFQILRIILLQKIDDIELFEDHDETSAGTSSHSSHDALFQDYKRKLKHIITFEVISDQDSSTFKTVLAEIADHPNLNLSQKVSLLERSITESIILDQPAAFNHLISTELLSNIDNLICVCFPIITFLLFNHRHDSPIPFTPSKRTLSMNAPVSPQIPTATSSTSTTTTRTVGPTTTPASIISEERGLKRAQEDGSEEDDDHACNVKSSKKRQRGLEHLTLPSDALKRISLEEARGLAGDSTPSEYMSNPNEYGRRARDQNIQDENSSKRSRYQLPKFTPQFTNERVSLKEAKRLKAEAEAEAEADADAEVAALTDSLSSLGLGVNLNQ